MIKMGISWHTMGNNGHRSGWIMMKFNYSPAWGPFGDDFFFKPRTAYWEQYDGFSSVQNIDVHENLVRLWCCCYSSERLISQAGPHRIQMYLQVRRQLPRKHSLDIGAQQPSQCLYQWTMSNFFEHWNIQQIWHEHGLPEKPEPWFSQRTKASLSWMIFLPNTNRKTIIFWIISRFSH